MFARSTIMAAVLTGAALATSVAPALAVSPDGGPAVNKPKPAVIHAAPVASTKPLPPKPAPRESWPLPTLEGTPLDSSQLANAQAIYNEGKALGLPAKARIIALATAMQESTLHNYTNAVDHDSLGLFQQRPSCGWGTPAQIEDPTYASKRFYEALENVPGWQSMTVTEAAQDVQGSAYPYAYEKWAGTAWGLNKALGG